MRHRHHLTHRNAVVTHPLGIKLNLVLFDVSSEHRYLRHSSGRQQTRTDSPVGNRTEVEHGGRVGRQPDNEHFAQNRRLRAECRFSNVDRKRFTDYSELFTHNLSGKINICSPVEFHPDNRKTIGGRRTDTAYAGSSVYGSFHRESHELFNLFGGHTIGFGHDDNRRRVEVGKHVYFRVHGSVAPRNEQKNGSAEHQQPVVQGIMYDFIKHLFKLRIMNEELRMKIHSSFNQCSWLCAGMALLALASLTWYAPSVTTRSPAFTPDRIWTFFPLSAPTVTSCFLYPSSSSCRYTK